MNKTPWNKEGLDKIKPVKAGNPFAGENSCKEISNYLNHHLDELMGRCFDDCEVPDMNNADSTHYLKHLAESLVECAAAVTVKTMQHIAAQDKPIAEGKKESVDLVANLHSSFNECISDMMAQDMAQDMQGMREDG